MNARDVERQLREQRMPEPPAGLVKSIKDEIPAQLEGPRLGGAPGSGRPRVARRVLLAAAAMAGLALGGLALWRVAGDRGPSGAVRVAEGARLEVTPLAAGGPAADADDRAQQVRGEVAPLPALPALPRPNPPPVSAQPTARPAPTIAPQPVVAPDALRELVVQVTDETGRPVPGTTITLRGGKLLGPRSAVTGADGRSAMSLLPPGRYEAVASMPGYQRVEIGDIDLDGPVRTAQLDVTLASAFAEEVLVTAEAPVADVTSTTIGVPLPTGSSGRRDSARANRAQLPEPHVQLPAGVFRSAPAPLPWSPSRPEAGPPPDVVPPSTGGTAEPNDQPYGDVFFSPTGVNPFVDTEDDRLSTFGLEVDTGSYGVARTYLEAGHLPPHAAIRVEEFLNAFDYGDPPPEKGDFALTAEGAPAPFAPGPRYVVVRFGVRARVVDPAARKPALLVFTVDVSGSMARGDRLGLVKKALFELLDHLRPGDRVGLVVYGSSGRVLLEPTGDLEAVRAAVDRLAPGGATNAEEGLVLAYGLAERYRREGEITRVILCSDGVANVGRTGPDTILERVRRATGDGVELTTVGFGMGNYNDVLMERLADAGDGRYAYVDSLREARRLFVEELTGTLQTVAADAKAQVVLNPEAVTRYRLLGYENRDIADERFRDPTVDAGEIGAGHAVTAVYELKLAEKVPRSAVLATLRVRYRPVDGDGGEVELERVLHRRDLAPSWEQAPSSLRLASLVAELAEVLKGSYWAKGADLHDVLERLQRLGAERPGDARLVELTHLVARAAGLEDERKER